MPDPLSAKRIVLGVCGSIAAFKAAGLASRLTQRGALVDVVLTRAAAELVRPLAFQALTHRPVTTDLFDPQSGLGMDHLALAKSADLLVVAPATADVIARLALGLAGDALTTTALATHAPLVVVPAMEPNMWHHPATEGHVATLAGRGATLVGPVAGRLASGEVGDGRLPEPDEIADHLAWRLARGGPLAERHVVVTAGPTREALDPVRYLSNHSSGHMGYALARSARDLGADVTLVTGPVALAPPVGVAVVPVETAADMLAAVLSAVERRADALIMTAAVADYRPREASQGKVKKAKSGAGGSGWTLELVANPDILAEVARAVAQRPPAARPLRVGFAAETENLVDNARAKLAAKDLDLIVANPVPQSFGAGEVEITLVDGTGATVVGRLPKQAAADRILAAVIDRLAKRP